MKQFTKHISMFLFILSFTLFITSCSSDDKDENPAIEGEYLGSYRALSTSGKEIEASLLVTKEGKDAYLLKFSTKTAHVMPSSYTIKLTNTGVDGIWQAASVSPYVQFYTNDKSVLISSNSGTIYTFQGKK